MSEENYRAFALSTDAIHDVIKYPCKDSRSNSSQFKCNKKCCDSLGTISQAVNAITILRRKLWIDPKQLSIVNLKCMKGKEIRNAKLIEILFSMLNENIDINEADNYPPNKRFCKFILGDNKIEVCKHFFRIATCVDEKQFNEILNFVIHSKDVSRRQTRFDDIIQGLTFLSVCGEGK